MRKILSLVRLPIIGAVAALWGCPNRPVEPSIPQPHSAGNQEIPVSIVRELDILFMIDDSPSMAPKQNTLDSQFNALMLALNSLQGGFPDAHIGVVSSDLGTGPYTNFCAPQGGDGGRLQATANNPLAPNCSPPGGGKPYIEITNADGVLSGNIANVDTPTADGLGCQGLKGTDGVTQVPAAGDTAIDICDIQAAFRCVAHLGQTGCGMEQSLEAAKRALFCDEENACTNPGFLRPEAILAVVFLTDEDDCSARNDTVFNTADTATYGPRTSYRCFEYGVTCTPSINRTGNQSLTDCRSKTIDDTPDRSIDQLFLHPVSEYQDFFRTLKAAPDQVVLAAITAPFKSTDTITTGLDGSFQPKLQPSCNTSVLGDPAVRINELVRSFGANGVVLADQPGSTQGICEDDFSPALKRLGEVIKSLVNPGCLGAPLVTQTDEGTKLITDPNQANCSVTEVTPTLTGNVSANRPRCVFADDIGSACGPEDVSPGPLNPEASDFPCWYICDKGSAAEGGCEYRWQMRFCRDQACDPTTPAPANTTALVQCVSCNPKALGCLCGDYICQNGNGGTEDVGENATNCTDCRCGNGVCEDGSGGTTDIGESATSCPQDCN